MGSELCAGAERPKTLCWPCKSNAREVAWIRNLNVVEGMSDPVRGREQLSVNKRRLYFMQDVIHEVQVGALSDR